MGLFTCAAVYVFNIIDAKLANEISDYYVIMDSSDFSFTIWAGSILWPLFYMLLIGYIIAINSWKLLKWIFTDMLETIAHKIASIFIEKEKEKTRAKDFMDA